MDTIRALGFSTGYFSKQRCSTADVDIPPNMDRFGVLVEHLKRNDHIPETNTTQLTERIRSKGSNFMKGYFSSGEIQEIFAGHQADIGTLRRMFMFNNTYILDSWSPPWNPQVQESLRAEDPEELGEFVQFRVGELILTEHIYSEDAMGCEGTGLDTCVDYRARIANQGAVNVVRMYKSANASDSLMTDEGILVLYESPFLRHNFPKELFKPGDESNDTLI
ncbi:hypothetical protein M422DRAFT_239375 [Sphaerobolus stellatus SS14]|nr:hypothetical protein M422DRAFT_239375 [Sphaerobolus stellatus SS14]